MIYTQFLVKNPWVKDKPYQKRYFFDDWKLTTHKHLSIDLNYDPKTLINFCLVISHRQDHAGIDFGLGLFGFQFCIEFYDHRHWNDETDNWEEYDQKN